MIRKIILTLVLILTIFAIFNLVRQTSLALQASKRLDKDLHDLNAIQKQNTDLRNKLSLTQQADFIEQQARDKLNRAKDNETVVIIPEDLIQKVLSANIKPVKVKLPNWQAWLKLFLH